MKNRNYFSKLLRSIKRTLEVFPTMNSCLGPAGLIERMRETTFNTTVK